MMMYSELIHWTALISAAWLAYHVLKALYNISPLHPLYKIPGPRLAAASYLNEFYHDIILGGRYTHAIKKMHEEFGPIVRINPWEVHCNDIDFAEEIFTVGGRKRDKPMHHVWAAGIGPTNTFGAASHDLHRSRKAPLAKMFSHAMISRLESEINGYVNRLCDKLLEESGKGPFDVTVAYSCFTSDAIFRYCFGESNGFLDQVGWEPNFREPSLAVIKYSLLFKFFPSLVKIQQYAVWYVFAQVIFSLRLQAKKLKSVRFLDYLPSDIAFIVRSLKVTMPELAFKTKARLDAGIRFDRPTIFETLLNSDLKGEEKRLDRLVDEAVQIVAAGTETTSWALSVITYHLLDKPGPLERLRKELLESVEDARDLPAWTTLEKLPYMSAVIQEGLRLSYGVSGPIALEAPDEDLIYRGEFDKKPVEFILPRGSAMAMSSYIMHHDESVFPDSHSFIPERWLVEQQQRRKGPEKGFMAFSKGPRICLGKK